MNTQTYTPEVRSNTMRRNLLSLLFFMVFFAGSLLAQTPDGINYQGVARDASGTALTNQNISLRFTLHSGTATGPVEYSETHATTTNALGLFDLVLGQGTAVQGTFATVNWGSNDHFMQMEMDPAGGANYGNMGTSQLMAVPYALSARNVENDMVDDADADPANEIQTLSVSGSTVTLSNGGGTFVDQVNDADPSPTNEIQTLSKSGSTVTLSNGGGSFTDDTDDGQWVSSGSDIYNGNSGDVGIGVTNPTHELSVENDLSVNNTSNQPRVVLDIFSDRGYAEVLGANGNRNVALTIMSGNNNLGSVGVYNSAGDSRVILGQVGSGNNVGSHWTMGDNGNLNCWSTFLSGYQNHGFTAVQNSSGNNEAGMYVNASGQGVVFGDIKNFRMEHPTEAGKEIWYASLEGPEAGAYTRGTSSLVNGTAAIQFPDHFELVANAATLTVIVTPLDGSSKGLAVVEKTAQGFKVVELHAGTGNYAFDWEVKGVRKGYENYRVIRDASECQPGGLDAEGNVPRTAE